MASQYTNYHGRRCTKVRRALPDNAHNSTAKAAPIETASPTEQEQKQPPTTKKSVYAPTTATPNPSAQIAVPHIPHESQHAQVTAAAPPPSPPPSDPAPPPPPPPPQPAAPPPSTPETQPPVVVAPAPPAVRPGGSSQNSPPPAAPGPINQPNVPSTGQGGSNVAPVVAAPKGGNDGSSGGNGGSNGQIQQPQALGIESLRPAGGSPVQPALFTSPTAHAGSNEHGVSPEPQMANSPIPVLITFTSKGVVRTTSSMFTPSSAATVKGKNGNDKGGFTTASPKTGAIPTAPSTAGNFTSHQKASSGGIIAGVVSGVTIVAIICGLLFFCARKRRKSWEEKERRSSISAEPFGAKKRQSSVSTRFTGFFGRRKVNSTSSDETQRSNSPSLERGLARSSMAENPASSRIRSSSEPASRTLNLGANPSYAQSAAIGAATISTAGAVVASRNSFGRKTPDGNLRAPPPTWKPADSHRRSVSSVSGMAYPVLSETNNPFMDPDPNAQLRIINPDMSRTATPASTPRRGLANTPTTPAMFTPTRGGLLTPTTPGTGSSTVPSPFRRERPKSPVQNPFADLTSDPFADPAIDEPLVPMLDPLPRDSGASDSQYSNYSPALSMASQRTSRHSRSRTFTNIPHIIRTAPSVSSSYHAPHGSSDSGFASMAGTATSSPSVGGNSPATMNRGFGLGIDRSPSNSSARSGNDRNLMPLPLRPIPASPRTPPPRQDPSHLAIPARLNHHHISRDHHHNNPPLSATSIMSNSTTVSSTHRPLSTHSDNSSSSLSSSTMSLSFPSSWGEPGPTRPASQATMNNGTESAAGPSSSITTAAAGTVGGLTPGGRQLHSRSSQSRVSDPFDLDVPELLAYASSETHYSASELRRGSASTAATGSNVGIDSVRPPTRRRD